MQSGTALYNIVQYPTAVAYGQLPYPVGLTRIYHSEAET